MLIISTKNGKVISERKIPKSGNINLLIAPSPLGYLISIRCVGKKKGEVYSQYCKSINMTKEFIIDAEPYIKLDLKNLLNEDFIQ